MKHRMIPTMIAAAMALSAAALPVCAAETGSIDLFIDRVQGRPGEEVAVSVTVENDTNGINSYILDLAAEGNFTAVSAENGTAYEALSLVSNLEDLVFAGTNYSIDNNIRASENGAAVFTIIFQIPEDAVPGTYSLTFDDTIIYDMNMQQVSCTHTTGSITVLGGEIPIPNTNLGDVDEDGDVDAADAANILVAAAAVGAGGESGLTEQQKKNADVNGNGDFDSTDAAYVLQYAAAAGAGYSGTINDFMASLE